jgi:hypothetical protein
MYVLKRAYGCKENVELSTERKRSVGKSLMIGTDDDEAGCKGARWDATPRSEKVEEGRRGLGRHLLPFKYSESSPLAKGCLGQ